MRVFLKKILLYQRKDIRLLMTREIKKEILSRNLPILNCSRWLKMRQVSQINKYNYCNDFVNEQHRFVCFVSRFVNINFKAERYSRVILAKSIKLRILLLLIIIRPFIVYRNNFDKLVTTARVHIYYTRVDLFGV